MRYLLLVSFCRSCEDLRVEVVYKNEQVVILRYAARVKLWATSSLFSCSEHTTSIAHKWFVSSLSPT